MTQLLLQNHIGKYCHLVNLPGTCTKIAVGRPDNKQNCCRTGEEIPPLVAIVMMSKTNRLVLHITNSKCLTLILQIDKVPGD